jgi:S-adenosylmethionine-dependent methyltransferase
MPEPRAALQQLRERLAPGGYLSLMFYNINSLMLTHALHGNVKKLLAGAFAGHPGGLTPPNPLAPAQVYEWLDQLQLEIVSQCGIRTISEYLPESPRFDQELMLALERRYCRDAPFMQLARYLHVLCRLR